MEYEDTTSLSQDVGSFYFGDQGLESAGASITGQTINGGYTVDEIAFPANAIDFNVGYLSHWTYARYTELP